MMIKDRSKKIGQKLRATAKDDDVAGKMIVCLLVIYSALEEQPK